MAHHRPHRWLPRTLVVAAAVTTLAVGCAEQPERVATAAAADDRPAPSVGEQTTSTTERLDLWDPEGYKVGAEHGVDATVTGEQMDAQSDRINERLLIEGTGTEGVRARYLDPPGDVGAAYQVLEAIELRDPSGKIVGYWGAYFIPVDEYQAELARARILTDQYEATNPQK